MRVSHKGHDITSLESGQVEHKISGHQADITSLSMRQPQSDLMISVDTCEAFLWDFKTFQKIRQLCMPAECRVRSVGFKS